MKRILFLLAFLACAVPSFAQEVVVPATPVQPAATTQWRIYERRFITEPDWTAFISLRPNTTAAQAFWCLYGAQTRVVSTPNPPINGVPQPDTVVSTPNVGVSCSNGFSNINAPVGFADVAAMLKALNKNASPANSTDKRIYTQLLADGVFTGSITGTAQ